MFLAIFCFGLWWGLSGGADARAGAGGAPARRSGEGAGGGGQVPSDRDRRAGHPRDDRPTAACLLLRPQQGRDHLPLGDLPRYENLPPMDPPLYPALSLSPSKSAFCDVKNDSRRSARLFSVCHGRAGLRAIGCNFLLSIMSTFLINSFLSYCTQPVRPCKIHLNMLHDGDPTSSGFFFFLTSSGSRIDMGM